MSHTAVTTPPISTRSIYTDHGPIARPPLTLASGTGATITDPMTATLPGGLITPSMLGLYVTLTGTTLNNGTYRIVKVVSPTIVKLNASFRLPDPSNGSLSWKVFDPRNGQIADSPSDVIVRINGVPTTPLSVNGLLGQIELSSPPNHGDDVKVDYSWIDNPTVDFVALNDPSFCLNGGGSSTISGHKYQYRNQLISPSNYQPTNIQSKLAQPLQKDLKYRAFERKYTSVLNDPTSLVLNNPKHKIAFPQLSRIVSQSFVSYGATGLPESDPINPWTRIGTGVATVASDLLTVAKTTSGSFPTGDVLYWSRPIDLTFPHVLAATWRNYVTATPITEGVFTGIAAGYSDDTKAIVVGYLNNGGTKQVGILIAGGGNDPSVLSAWGGGLDSNSNPTNLPVTLDWTVIHSYRVFRDTAGNISVFLDGDVNPTLRVLESQLPALEELTAPFNQIQGVFFGSLSYEASNTAVWEFYRYSIIPTNPLQVSPAVFVSYEGNVIPEVALPNPWTPIGYSGTENLFTSPSTYLLLDSTSATSFDDQVGLIGGDFRGYDRIEPLLKISSDVVLDVGVQLRTFTHGISPNAVMAAIDDGNRLIQLSFFPDQSSPLLSYGGRSLPTQFEPYTWSSMGTQSGAMYGRTLRITDTSSTDGLLYFIDDTNPITSPNRVVSPSTDYMLEFRVLVRSFTPDSGPIPFCGVNADVYDGIRALGVMFTILGSTHNVTLHSDGHAVASFPFNWNDGDAHTYRMTKDTNGDLVSMFIDGTYIGSTPYSSFSVPGSGIVGVISFGSTTPSSLSSNSTVDWSYCNVWRVLKDFKKYVGVWRGTDAGDLTDYHLPLKASGNARILGNSLSDPQTDFIASGVLVGDEIVIDFGPNKGTYGVESVTTNVLTVGLVQSTNDFAAFSSLHGGSSVSAVSKVHVVDSSLFLSDSELGADAYVVPFDPSFPFVNRTPTFIQANSTLSGVSKVHYKDHVHISANSSLTASGDVIAGIPPEVSPFPNQNTTSEYRIPKQVDWTQPHRYRVVRDPAGGIAVLLDTVAEPLIRLRYDQTDVPMSLLGVPRVINGALPSITFGAFDPTNLSQTVWSFVRYGITSTPSAKRIVPPYQVFNQRNVIASPEHLDTSIPHTHTDFWSSSTGIPPEIAPDFLRNPNLVAYTLLNEGTPLVPSTQTFEVRRPQVENVVIAGLNYPTNILNSQAFVLNDSTSQVVLVVPDDVLYTNLRVIETDTGHKGLIAPFDDRLKDLGTLSYQNEVCLSYDASTLPEQAPTPWSLRSDDSSQVTTSVFSGTLTYGTAGATRTAYLNNTHLPDSPGLSTQVTYRLKLLSDTSFGLGDTQVRFGLSAPKMTLSMGFVTQPTGERYVLVFDQKSGKVVGGRKFDFLDGNFHTYRLLLNPSLGTISIFIDN